MTKYLWDNLEILNIWYNTSSSLTFKILLRENIVRMIVYGKNGRWQKPLLIHLELQDIFWIKGNQYKGMIPTILPVSVVKIPNSNDLWDH